MTGIIHHIKPYLSSIEHYLHQGNQISVIVIDESLKIRETNAAFKQILGTKRSLEGDDFRSYLLSESRHILPLDKGIQNRVVPLNFQTQRTGSICLECHIYKQDNTHLILGGHVLHANHQIIEKMTKMTSEMANLMRSLTQKNRELEDARSKIKILGGIIPICMHCKKIRDDEGYWNKLEQFITEHSEAQFSHSICDACMEKFYPDDDDEEED